MLEMLVLKGPRLVNKNNRCAKTALEMMSKDPKIEVPEDYIAKWQKAVYTFKHALIYDIKEKKLKHLTPLPEELLKKTPDELDFLGKVFDNKVAIEIAEGRMDPITRRPFARAQPHFQHQHQQRYNNNNNNTQSMNRDRKFPKSTSILCLRRRKVPLSRLQHQPWRPQPWQQQQFLLLLSLDVRRGSIRKA